MPTTYLHRGLHPPHIWAVAATPRFRVSLLTPCQENHAVCVRPTLPTPVPPVSPSPHQCQGPRGPHTCHRRAWQPHLRPRTRRAGHRAPWTLPSPPLHSHHSQDPARRARGPPYLPPAAGLGPQPPRRPPPPSWAPQGPDSLTPLPQGAGADAETASAPRGTLRPLRKPHSAASGDHGDGRGAAAPSGAREGSGAEAGASGDSRARARRVGAAGAWWLRPRRGAP